MIGQRKKVWFSLMALTVLVASAALAFFAGPLKGTFAQASAPTVNETSTPFSGPWGTAFDSSGRVWVAIPGCDPSPKCGTTFPGKIIVYNPQTGSWPLTYNLPANFAQPLFVAIDKQGRVWFPEPMNNSLGMLDPSTNTFNQWAVPTAGSGPWGVAIDSKGKVWLTEHYVNQIASFDPTTHVFKEYATLQADTQPYGITVDASDNVWFAENNSSVAKIGEYTAQGNLREYKIRTGSTNGLTPHLITTDHNGNIWWSEGWVGSIGKLNIASAAAGTKNGVTEYTYPRICASCSAHTSGIAVDNGSTVWFTDSVQNSFGSFNPGSSAFSQYPLASNSHPHDGMNVDAHNTLWFTEEFGNKLAKVALPSTGGNTPTPSPTATKTPSPTPTTPPSPTPTKAPSPTATTVPSPTAVATKTPSPTVTTTPTSTAIATKTPSPTATTTAVPTASPTASPTPSPIPGSTLGQDTFHRADQDRWGTASDGQKWFGDANVDNSFSLSENAGIVSNSSGSYSAILGKSATNEDVVFTGSITNFTNNNFGAVLRWTDPNNWYKAYINGSNLIIQKKVNGSTTILAQIPFKAIVVTDYSIHFRVVGTTLTANVWDSSKSEQSGWMATATDSSLTSGYAGMRMQALNGTTFIASSFKAISLP